MAEKMVGDMKLYDVIGIAELMQVSEETVRTYIRAGKLPASKFGGRFWIKEESIQAWMDGTLPWQQAKNNGN